MSSALFAYRWANRPSVWFELAAPFVLALSGVLFVGPEVLWVLAAALAAASFPRGKPVKRGDLVRGWNAHILRSVSVAFGDVLSLLPQGRPVHMRLTDPFRFAVAGVLARRSALPLAVLLAMAVPVLRHVFPVVSSAWWAGLGAYLAVLPFAGGLAEVVRIAGLRRWVPATTRSLKLAAFAVLGVAAALWTAATALLGLPFVPLVVPLAAWAVVRTVTRPDLDYGAGTAVDVGGLYTPVGLVAQLLRGPDLLLLGVLVLSYFHSS
ncbi:hypothetical protein JOD54_001030 [Actinokineospora baliensis]|uniref:hypothetical protein n=1 Tax=Actinokineospora baliensis TaxID=547056 RepID=UPI001956D813|nr:hypothetical protein [Actinokineospora baliensis]MBM7770826.1 hypothetical protein [Actinokineospora baliensis]